MMFAISALLLLVSPIFARKDEFIVGGRAAATGAWPWQGGWIESGSFSCGCVLVHTSWVLTAGHCVGNTPDAYTMYFGSNTREQGTLVSVLTVTRHPNYNEGNGSYPNDLAVVGTSVPMQGWISPVGAIDRPGIDRVGQTCFITGWGRTCGICALPTALMEVQIPVIDDATCTAEWADSYHADVHICVWGGDGGGIGACNGDSGGPLVCRASSDAPWDLVGVTSWGRTGCGTNQPSVYTRLSNYRAFICQETGQTVACD